MSFSVNQSHCYIILFRLVPDHTARAIMYTNTIPLVVGWGTNLCVVLIGEYDHCG
jgi:hypothetical protein